MLFSSSYTTTWFGETLYPYLCLWSFPLGKTCPVSLGYYIAQSAGKLDSDAAQWGKQENYRLVPDTERGSVICMQSKLLCTIIDLSKLTVNFTVICFLKFASSHPDCGRYCYSLGLCSMQAFVPQQDCVVYLSGIGVIELQLSTLTWDWLGFLQTSFHLIRAFWDRNVTFFGAASNCLGRGCPTGNQWSPKQAEAKGLFSYFCHHCSWWDSWLNSFE